MVAKQEVFTVEDFSIVVHLLNFFLCTTARSRCPVKCLKMHVNNMTIETNMTNHYIDKFNGLKDHVTVNKFLISTHSFFDMFQVIHLKLNILHSTSDCLGETAVFSIAF